MNFLGVGPMEIVLILLIAFIFLGPERMTEAARLVAKLVREGRNLAADLPRVVVENDEIKIVERGKSTSLISDRPVEPTVEPDPQDDAGEDGPVPFSRTSSPPPTPSVDDSKEDGQLR